MKKAWIIVIIVLSVIAIIGGYAVLNTVFPKADPISSPAIEDTISISITQNNGEPITVENTEFEAILQSIIDSRPTRKMSVNDYPTAKTYYIFTIYTSEREYRYFVYEENSDAYIEIPYEGIYETDQCFFNFAAGYFKS